ncbi:MAG: hypothetical protein NT128_02925 [Proteobacteria bacterium]|nr:hypothetical protein [Pseudomonadota bacterium]
MFYILLNCLFISCYASYEDSTEGSLKKPVNSQFVHSVEFENTHVTTFRNNLKKISDEYYKGYLKDIKTRSDFWGLLNENKKLIDSKDILDSINSFPAATNKQKYLKQLFHIWFIQHQQIG